jgi:hypothetical protein
MKSRPGPNGRGSENALSRLLHDPQMKKWAQRLRGDAEARPHDLDEAELRFIATEIVKRRGEDFSQTHFDRAFEATRPVLAVPDVTDPVADLDLILNHVPEMTEFWAAWQRPFDQRGKRGPAAADEAVKALMTVMAIPGMTTNTTHAHTMLTKMPELQQAFTDVAARVAANAGRAAPKPFAALSYGGATRHRPEVAAGCTGPALAANITLLKYLRETVSDRVGKTWLIDGCAIPAWAPQKSALGNEAVEEELRRHAPEAGFRAIGYTSNGKRDLLGLDGEAVKSAVKGGKSKSWRGYYLVVLVEQVTGLPGVWTLIDAREQETSALVSLLSLLYSLWPEVGAEIVAGDSAFDDDPCCRLCEVEYGIHPVFRLHDAKSKEIPRGTVRGDKLVALSARGELICAAHGKPVEVEAFDRPSRQGLRPGQTSKEVGFRCRLLCQHDRDRAGNLVPPCGRLSFPASFDWSMLTHYPHHDHGRPDLYALRQVLLSARLGQVESVFNALKAGYKLGGADASRTRIRERHVHEALISLAFLGRTALTVADQRAQQGQGAATPSSNGGAHAGGAGGRSKLVPAPGMSVNGDGAGETVQDHRAAGGGQSAPASSAEPKSATTQTTETSTGISNNVTGPRREGVVRWRRRGGES